MISSTDISRLDLSPSLQSHLFNCLFTRTTSVANRPPESNTAGADQLIVPQPPPNSLFPQSSPFQLMATPFYWWLESKALIPRSYHIHGPISHPSDDLGEHPPPVLTMAASSWSPGHCDFQPGLLSCSPKWPFGFGPGPCSFLNTQPE